MNHSFSLLARPAALLVSLAVLAACSKARKIEPNSDANSSAPHRAEAQKYSDAPHNAPAAPLDHPGGLAESPQKQKLGGPITEVSGPGLLAHIRASGAKATVVNAWASWCGPCRREFPMLVDVAKKMKAKGVDVVFVSVDEPESHADAIKFFKENGALGPVFVAERPLGEFKAALHPDWPGMLPATFLFDETGTLRYFWGGPVYEEELIPIVEKQLRGETVTGEMRYGLQPGIDYRNQ